MPVEDAERQDPQLAQAAEDRIRCSISDAAFRQLISRFVLNTCAQPSVVSASALQTIVDDALAVYCPKASQLLEYVLNLRVASYEGRSGSGLVQPWQWRPTEWPLSKRPVVVQTLSLQLRHECRTSRCTLEKCDLCPRTKDNSCGPEHQLPDKYVESSSIKALCQARIRAVLVGSDNEPAVEQSAALRLEVQLLNSVDFEKVVQDWQAPDPTNNATIIQVSIFDRTVAGEKDVVKIPEQVLNKCVVRHDKRDQPLQRQDLLVLEDSRRGVEQPEFLPFKDGEVDLSKFKLKKSSEAVMHGRRAKFRLLLRVVHTDGRPCVDIPPLVSTPFVVKTRRTKPNEKGRTLAPGNGVEKVKGIGSKTRVKLSDLVAAAGERNAALVARIPKHLRNIRTVSQLQELVEWGEQEAEFDDGITRLLQLNPDTWEEAVQHLTMVEMPDLMPRQWTCPHTGITLVYKCQLGGVDLKAGLLGMLRPGTDGPLLKIDEAEQLFQLTRSELVDLQTRAEGDWMMWRHGAPGPPHPHWGIARESATTTALGLRMRGSLKAEPAENTKLASGAAGPLPQSEDALQPISPLPRALVPPEFERRVVPRREGDTGPRQAQRKGRGRDQVSESSADNSEESDRMVDLPTSTLPTGPSAAAGLTGHAREVVLLLQPQAWGGGQGAPSDAGGSGGGGGSEQRVDRSSFTQGPMLLQTPPNSNGSSHMAAPSWPSPASSAPPSIAFPPQYRGGRNAAQPLVIIPPTQEMDAGTEYVYHAMQGVGGQGLAGNRPIAYFGSDAGPFRSAGSAAAAAVAAAAYDRFLDVRNSGSYGRSPTESEGDARIAQHLSSMQSSGLNFPGLAQRWSLMLASPQGPGPSSGGALSPQPASSQPPSTHLRRGLGAAFDEPISVAHAYGLNLQDRPGPGAERLGLVLDARPSEDSALNTDRFLAAAAAMHAQARGQAGGGAQGWGGKPEGGAASGGASGNGVGPGAGTNSGTGNSGAAAGGGVVDSEASAFAAPVVQRALQGVFLQPSSLVAAGNVAGAYGSGNSSTSTANTSGTGSAAAAALLGGPAGSGTTWLLTPGAQEGIKTLTTSEVLSLLGDSALMMHARDSLKPRER